MFPSSTNNDTLCTRNQNHSTKFDLKKKKQEQETQAP
jgi:hypothetical protein